MTNFGPRADLSPTIGRTWPNSPWRREIIRTSDTNPSTMGVFRPSPTLLDRLVHNSHRLPMTGESMRKLSAKKRVLDDAPKPESMSSSATHLPLTIARNGCSRSRGTGAQHVWNAQVRPGERRRAVECQAQPGGTHSV